MRYGYDGREPPEGRKKDESNPYFTFDPSQVHRLQPLRARLRRNARHVRADHQRARLRFARRGRAGRSPSWNPNACPAAPASQACPTATLLEKTVIAQGQAEHSVITTCAYCGVGCGFKAEMKGDAVVRMVPWKDGQANEGHCLRQRPLRLGLRDPQGPHHQADDPREDHRPVARSVAGTRRSTTPPPSSGASRQSTAAIPSAA